MFLCSSLCTWSNQQSVPACVLSNFKGMSSKMMPPATALQMERTNLTLDGAKELYGLVEHELLWEQKHDTKCLMAFGPDAIVVAFRGTASLKNASADIQVLVC